MQIKKIFLVLLYLSLISISIPFLLGFFNTLHPLCDSLSNFRVHLLVLLLAIFVLIVFLHEHRNYQLFYIILLSFGGFYLYHILQEFHPLPLSQKKNHQIKQMQFNLSFRNQEIDKVIEYIKKNPMDIITFQEVTDAHREALQTLQIEGYGVEFKKDYPFIERKKGAYPYQAYCEFRGVGGGAILSKYPINNEKTVCIQGEGLLWAEVQTPEQSIYVASIHLFWPFPYRQQKQIKTLIPVLTHIPKPTLISGDFNAVAWSDAVEKIAKASNTKVVKGLRWSIELKKQLPLLPFMKLSIDHLLISKELEIEQINVKKGLGSDHLPIVSLLRY